MKEQKEIEMRKSIRRKVAEQIKAEAREENNSRRVVNRKLVEEIRKPRATITLPSGKVRSVMEWAYLRKAARREKNAI